MNKFRSLLFIILTISFSSMATTTWAPEWNSLTLSSDGPESAGLIQVEANHVENDKLKLKVNSNYGRFTLEDGLNKAQINTITITRYDESVKNFSDLFYVCLFFGDDVLINKGTEANPRKQWQFNLAVYVFRKDNVTLRIFKNTDKRWIAPDCWP